MTVTNQNPSDDASPQADIALQPPVVTPNEQLLISMRASSPPHPTSSLALSDPTVKELSALGTLFKKEFKQGIKGKQIFVLLDYDGTLSPIVDNPDRAFMPPTMREAVREVAKQYPTAIITGRGRDKVFEFVQLAELFYAGSHGMDITGPASSSKTSAGTNLHQPASEFLPMINQIHDVLLEKTKSIPGAKVEHNKYCASVHFRCVEEKEWGELAEEVRSVLKDYPQLRLTQGRKVLEIRPDINWNKGKALEYLLDTLGYTSDSNVFPIYIGDDRTDEDAFKVLKERNQGLGILVSKVPKETNASYYLQEPSEVESFLVNLVKKRGLFSIASSLMGKGMKKAPPKKVITPKQKLTKKLFLKLRRK